MGEIKTAYPLIHNKVTSPHYVTPTLRRGRLIDWLNDHADCRAVVVAAEAGYGKTTLLWQWEREAQVPCYWYKLDRNDRDWSLHISYLIEAIAQRHPGFGHRAHSMLLQLGGPGSSRPGVAAFLLAEMHERLTEPCTFIIDDWQFVASQTEVRGLWNQILRDAPPTCRFVFLSRAKPQLQFARFRTHGGYGELRTDALRFTEEEIDALFRDIYADPLEASELTELDRKTEGWAASLQLVEVSLREKQSPGERRAFIESITASSDSDLFAFLAEEVLDQQTEETRNFLLCTSILQQITPELAERMTGVRDGSELLADLEQRGLFTNRLGDAEERYRYHGLFRDFLERRLVAERTDAEVVGLHIHAASYYETTLQWPQAIHHYLRAGLQRQAARLIAKYGEDVVGEGRLGLIDEWLDQLPAKTIRDNARLSLLHGEALGTIRGEWDAALAALERGRSFFERKNDKRMQSLSLLKISSIYSAMGRVSDAAAFAGRGLSVVPSGADVIRLRLEGNLAVSDTWINGNLEDVAAACRRIAVETTARGLDHYAAIANHNMGMVLRFMGRLSESADALERAARFWDGETGSPFADHCELVQTLLAMGQTQLAETWSDRGLRATKAWPRPHLEARWAKAAVVASKGRFDEAIEILESLSAKRAQLGAVADMVWSLLAECLYLSKRPSNAMREPLTALGDAADPRLAGLVAPARALAIHSLGSCRGECLAVQESYMGLRDHGATYLAMIGEVKTGAIALDHEGASAIPRAIRAIGEAREYRAQWFLRFWLREYERHIPLLLASPAGRDAVMDLIRHDPENWSRPVAHNLADLSVEDRQELLGVLMRHATPKALQDLPAGQAPDIAEVRRALTQRHASRLYLRSLGLMALHRGAWTSPPTVVGKRRLALLLGLLLTHLRGSLPRDQVLDLLWPDADPDAAINSLNQTVFQLRRVLDPGYKDRESPTYITSSTDAVGLDPDLIRTDVDEFRTAAAHLHEATDSRMRTAAAEAMVSLARGEFLAELRYEDWVAEAQSAVHAELRMHLLPLARGEWDVPADMCIRAAGSLITLDRFDEAAHLALVDRLLAAGRRSAAREALRRFTLLMTREFDEEPTPQMLTALALLKLDPEEVKQQLTREDEGLTLRSAAH